MCGESVLSSIGSGGWSQVVEFWSKHFYPLSPPLVVFSRMIWQLGLSLRLAVVSLSMFFSGYRCYKCDEEIKYCSSNRLGQVVDYVRKQAGRITSKPGKNPKPLCSLPGMAMLHLCSRVYTHSFSPLRLLFTGITGVWLTPSWYVTSSIAYSKQC